MNSRFHSKDAQEGVRKCPVSLAIFDCLMYSGKGLLNTQLKDRMQFIEKFPDQAERVVNPADTLAFYAKAISKGYEGIMIKDISASYQFKRDWSVMKFKAFFDADVPIIGMQEGTGKHAGKLGSFLVDYKGVNVRVGSGLTDELRENLWADKDTHLGRIIEVRYQEVTPDGSLRFPTFVCFRNDKG